MIRKFGCLVAQDCIMARMSRAISERDLIKSFHGDGGESGKSKKDGGMERKLVTVAVNLYMEENVL